MQDVDAGSGFMKPIKHLSTDVIYRDPSKIEMINSGGIEDPFHNMKGK
jgi:hypothetical protein